MSLGSLSQATIVITTKNGTCAPYIAAHTTARDEVMYIRDHFNQTKTSTGIYIEDIRDLQVAARTSKTAINTVVVLEDASKMTLQAQNALLKLLEEPRERLHIVLSTHTPMQLLPTVRSRCQTVRMSSSATDVALPADKKARIEFMAGGDEDEKKRLIEDDAYFNMRSAQFALAKDFVGGDSLRRLEVISRVTGKRDTTLEFIEVTLLMLTSLLERRFTSRLYADTVHMLAADEAIRQNGNAKLQLLRCVV